MEITKSTKVDYLDTIYERDNNSFDLMRTFLAIIVIYSHSYPLLKGQALGSDLFVKFSNNQISGGSLAVISFFVISGFLITQSLVGSKNFFRYLLNRTLRIFPAFLCSLLLASFLIGPLITNLELKDYLNFDGNSAYKFIFYNISFNIFGFAWGIKDIFSTNPFPDSVNGSMWTLKHEFALYLLLPLAYYFYMFRLRKLMLISACLVSLLAILNISSGYKLFELTSPKYWVLVTDQYNEFIKLAAYFLWGSVIYLYKEKVILNNRLLIMAILITIFFSKIGSLNIVLFFTLPYIILMICTKLKFSIFKKYGDFSYGLYIYAFPIQQLIVNLGWAKNNIFFFFICSLLFTLIVSFFSWHFIERPSLNLKSIKRRRLKLNQ